MVKGIRLYYDLLLFRGSTHCSTAETLFVPIWTHLVVMIRSKVLYFGHPKRALLYVNLKASVYKDDGVLSDSCRLKSGCNFIRLYIFTKRKANDFGDPRAKFGKFGWAFVADPRT